MTRLYFLYKCLAFVEENCSCVGGTKNLGAKIIEMASLQEENFSIRTQTRQRAKNAS